MADTGRTPLMAILVSVLAVLFPALSGSPKTGPGVASGPAASKPAASESKTRKDAAEAPKAEAKPEPDGRAACDRETNTVYMGDAICEGAFGRFLNESEHAISPSPASGCLRLPHDHPRRLVATLPDPLETGMRASFDEGMEALFVGLESLHYLRDRYWSPWHDPELTQSGGPSAVASCALRVPAAFSFRRCESKTACEEIELFVVGESATSGVPHEATLRALRLASAAERRVHVIGPTFSGTAASLREAIDAVPADIRGSGLFSVTTGTASLKGVKRLLDDGERIRFSARVLSSDATRQGFFDYLQRTLPLAVPVRQSTDGKYRWLEHVALFTESGTWFGAGVQDRDVSNGKHTLNASVVVHFPLHVGMIRASLSEQQGGGHAESQGIGGISFHQVELHPGRDSADRRDTPAPLSNQTSASEDLVLAEETRVLEEEDIRVVGIFASDPVDALFLVRRLRERLPSAHLFVFEHDALFGHPEHASELRGVMLVSTYPSTARADRWMFPYKESERRFLSSPAATGIYNATLFGSGLEPLPDAPGLDSLVLAYAPPFESPPLGAKIRPSIWFSAVGMGSIVPVSAFPTVDDGYTTPVVRTFPATAGSQGVIDLDADNVFAASAWRTWSGCLDAVLVFLAFGVYLGASGEPLPVTMHWFRIFRRPLARHGFLVWHWRLATTLAILGYCLLALCLSSLAVPLLEARLWSTRVPVSPYADMLTQAHVALLAAVLLLGVWSFGLVLSNGRWQTRAFWVLAALAPIGVAFGAQYRFFTLASEASFRDLPLYYLRWTSLGSQLSPLVPVAAFFTILIVGASQYASEVKTGGKHRTETIAHVFGFEALKVPDGDPLTLVTQSLSRIQRVAIDCASIRKPPFLIGVLLAWWGISVVVAPTGGRFATVEHEVLTCGLGIGFFLAALTSAGGMSAMLTLASSLALLLRRIHAHPVGEKVSALGASLDFRLRLPFAALPEASGQIRCWFEKACALAALLPEGDPWREKVRGKSLERILAAHRSDDVVGSLEAALDGQPALPESQHVVLEQACGAQAAEAKGVATASAEPRPVDPLRAALQQLAAVEVLLFVFWSLRRLRTYAATSITCSLLFALGIASYPFEPARELSTVAAVFVLIALLTSLVTFVVLERDPLLSELTGRSPGEIDWNWSFVQQVITWVILPFLAFLATKYPEQVRTLLDWASPYVRAK